MFKAKMRGPEQASNVLKQGIFVAKGLFFVDLYEAYQNHAVNNYFCMLFVNHNPTYVGLSTCIDE